MQLHDGTTAGVGDRVIACRNERRLTVGHGWVKNGDQFEVVQRRDDGGMLCRRLTVATLIALPPAYVRDDLELAYATTGHRAQGMTVDTAHAVVTGPSLTRAVLYVAMTRGREGNHAYVCTDLLTDEYDLPGDASALTGSGILVHVLGRTSAELSAHESIRTDQQRQESLAMLVAEYETIAAQADSARWDALLAESGLDDLRTARTSPSWRALASACRYANAPGLDVDSAVPQLARLAPLSANVSDSVSELVHRVQCWIVTAHSDQPPLWPRPIVGLFPAFRVGQRCRGGPLCAGAVDQHEGTRTRARGHREQASVARRTRATPDDHQRQTAWDMCAETIVAYRDRYDVRDLAHALGDPPGAGWARQREYRLDSRAVLAVLNYRFVDDFNGNLPSDCSPAPRALGVYSASSAVLPRL